MKSIDSQLIAARPGLPYTTQLFVARTMDIVYNLKPRRNWRLSHLSKPALIALAIAALALISGTAYAIYTFWAQPAAHTQSMQQNQYGRTQAIIDLHDCFQQPGSATFEVKKGSDLTAQDIANTVQAQCETKAIESWGHSLKPNVNHTTEDINITPGSELADINGAVFTVNFDGAGNSSETANKDTVFVDKGFKTNKSAFKKGDAVILISDNTYGPQYGSPLTSTLLAVVKLSLPAKYYSAAMQNSLAERTPCAGNIADTCLDGGASIDVWPRGEGSNDSAPAPVANSLRIQGQIVSHSGANFVLKSSSGALYHLTASRDVISEFNALYAPNYQNATITVGDMLDVRYNPPATADKKVRANQIVSIKLLIDFTSKQNPPTKY